MSSEEPHQGEQEDGKPAAVETSTGPTTADDAENEGAPAVAANDEATDTAATATDDANTKPPPSKKQKRRKRSGLYPSFPLMLYKLMMFRVKNNHCRATTEDDPALGSWVALVRRSYSESKRGNPSAYLTQDRIDILNSIGFTWSLLQCSNDKRWESNFAKLLEFREKHGHCNAPQSTPLGKWVQMQRDQYRELSIRQSGSDTRTRSRPVITQDRMQRLNEVGFQWRVANKAAGWDARYEELVEYKRMYGNCNVPQGFKQNVPLGRWVMKQRVQYHKLMRGQKSQMKSDRVEKLEALGFQWVGPGARHITLSKKRKLSDADEEEDEVNQQHVVVQQPTLQQLHQATQYPGFYAQQPPNGAIVYGQQVPGQELDVPPYAQPYGTPNW